MNSTYYLANIICVVSIVAKRLHIDDRSPRKSLMFNFKLRQGFRLTNRDNKLLTELWIELSLQSGICYFSYMSHVLKDHPECSISWSSQIV